MIIDKLENLSMYRIVPDHVVDFVKNLKSDIKTGRYELIDKDYATIETYTTKNITDGKFEAHNSYIDIQILLEGKERIYYTSTSSVSVDIPYNSEKDIKFYSDKITKFDFVTLDGTNFAMIFPHEAHAPQVSIDRIQTEVKKVVVKVKI